MVWFQKTPCFVKNLSFLSCVRIRMPSAILKTDLPAAGDYNLILFFKISSWTVVCLDNGIALDRMLKNMRNAYVITNSHVKGWDLPSPLLSYTSPPAFSLSQHLGLFQRVSSFHQVAKILEFQLQHQSFQWTPSTDLFRMDWLDLLAVQGTLKSLLQHHSSKASILQHSAFLIVQLLHSYMTTGKTIALTGRTFVDKVMSLLFHM